MTRVYSDIRKFKKVEALIRENAVGFERIADEIDRAKTGRHTKAELEALTVARAQCLEIRRQVAAVLNDFWDAIEASRK